jgi:hypothetical protein
MVARSVVMLVTSLISRVSLSHWHVLVIICCSFAALIFFMVYLLHSLLDFFRQAIFNVDKSIVYPAILCYVGRLHVFKSDVNLMMSFCLHPQPWRWRRYVSLKRWHLPASLHGAKTQKINILTALKTSNLTMLICSIVLRTAYYKHVQMENVTQYGE